SSDPSLHAGARVPGGAQRCCAGCAPAALCPGAESGRIHLGALEASRAAQSVRPEPDRLEDQHAQSAALHAATALAGARVLAAGKLGTLMPSCIYASLNKYGLSHRVPPNFWSA